MFKLLIDKKILSETINCKRHFECLINENSKCFKMKVNKSINDSVIFIDCFGSCNYKVNYGNARICVCPTRKEIFKKYNL